MSDGPPAQVFLRPIGFPLSLGMSGLVVASLLQSGFDLHWVGKHQSLEIGLILLAVPFVLQLVACVLTYLARDGAAGASLGVLATTWLAVGLVHIASVPGHRSGALGLALLASGGALALSALTVVIAKPLPAALFFVEAIRFVLAGIYELGGTGVWRDVAGIVGLAVVAGAAYCLLAFELESQQRRPVLPTFRRGRGQAAVLGDPALALDDFVHEPGVRQTT